MVDWDTVGLAPAERDLWFLEARCPGSLSAYVDAGGRPANPSALDLYRRRWTLSDVAAFTRLFRSPHSRNADTERWASMTNHAVELR